MGKIEDQNLLFIIQNLFIYLLFKKKSIIYLFLFEKELERSSN